VRSRVADFQSKVAPQVQLKDEAWFLSQLQKACPTVVPKGKDFLIVCPFHADSNPSCGVDRHKGVFKCFSCSAGGSWNKLAAKLGMEKLAWQRDTTTDKGVEALQEGMSRALSKAGVANPDKKKDLHRPLVEAWPLNREWRGLSPDFLVKLGCVRVNDLKHNVERIGLPVRQATGELLGYTCRAIDPEDAEPKYAPLAADRTGWRAKELPARESLFLVDKVLAEGWDKLVIVEGPYDALRLYAEGIPAVAILGTNNWTDIKVSILSGLGLSAVAVMMDNDASGWDAQPRIIETLRSKIKVVGLSLPSSIKDPGGMKQKQLDWLKKKLDGLS
jgi:DNA primase